MTEETYDLVMVGGGIGGSGLATVMQRAGRSCLVLERTTEFPDRTKGEWTAPWGVAEAHRTGLFDVIVGARGHTITRHIGYDEIMPPDQAEAREIPLAFLPGIGGPMTQRHPDACQVLLDAAAAAGATTKRGVEEIHITPGPSPSVRYSHEGQEHVANTRLIVGADGRNSVVRRQLGLKLEKDPPHHMFSGLLVDDVPDWPEDLEAIGTSGDLHYLVFPQGGGRHRIYLGFALDQRNRFSGPEGPKEFLKAFCFDCAPLSAAISEGTPVSPCASYPNEDEWLDQVAVDGVVLIGDAAGWNDPIIGQGLSITLRDIRLVSEILTESDDWTVRRFAPYIEERSERLRRLRWTASFVATLNAEFGPEAAERRLRFFGKMGEDPAVMMLYGTVFAGPELAPPDLFTDETRERLLA